MNLWPPKMMSPTSNGRVIGYARVSTQDQKLDHQLDLFKRIQCDLVFYDHGISGGKADRPGLRKAVKTLQAGDLLVVYKLDRLGRSVLHLADLINRGIDTTTSGGKLIFHIFAAVAEFHRDLIRENTRNGLEAARSRGAKLGRPRKLTVRQAESAYIQMIHESLSAYEIAKRFEVSTSTLLRGFKREGLSYPTD